MALNWSVINTTYLLDGHKEAVLAFYEPISARTYPVCAQSPNDTGNLEDLANELQASFERTIHKQAATAILDRCYP